jgi:REP element-mobilizing transposase RayT
LKIKFYNPFEDVRITWNYLPHWQQAGATYFITYRLADAIPAPLMKRWKQEREAWMSLHPEPWTVELEDEYHRRFSSRIERWLDAGHGSCLLRDPRARRIVEESLCRFESERYHNFSWVIMPNHLHLLTTLHPDWLLEKVVFSWKRRSSGEINRLRGTAGQLWQHDYFDRMIRDGAHLENVVRYIRRNPAKANLRPGEFTAYESDAAKAIQ